MEPQWLRQPVRLQSDNFTSLARTPWAGKVLGEKYKNIVVPQGRGRAIGESWEFSCDPAYPSIAVEQQIPLQQIFDLYPKSCFGDGVARCDILLKLLNPASPLSLQVHPWDEDAGLGLGECGKPESWLILEADPGAGLYLGFSQPLSRDELRDMLARGQNLEPYLQFVPVKPGDYFDIEPGVVHAIGAGVTLLEPQRVIPGLAGKTYRFWDWDRKYGKDGRASDTGEPRPLHWQQALALVEPAAQQGEEFVRNLRRTAHDRSGAAGVHCLTFPPNSYYQVHSFQSHAKSFSLNLSDSFAALVVLQGSGKFGGVTLRGGESALLPHSCFPLDISPLESCAFVVVHPANQSLEIKA